MGKRGNNEGTIRRREDGRWEARYTVHTGGGPKQRSVYGKTREEVRQKLTKATADRDGGLVYDAGKLTVGEYLDKWLADSVKDTVRQCTYDRYESLVRVHAKPALGRAKLKNVTPAHVRGLYRSKLEAGLSAQSVVHLHRCISKALKQAVDDGLIPRNAAASVRPPRPRREEIRPLSREQVHTLLTAVSGDRLKALYVVAITAGLRRGELLGLKWEDVDLEEGTLQVRRTLSETRGGRLFEAPKSGKGRSIRLTKRAIAALTAHRARQAEEKIRLGSAWQEHGLVFASKVGTPIQGRNIMRHFKIRLDRAGLPSTFRFHDLRHTCATLLLRQGVHVKYVQELLGHADIALTLNVYSHVLPDMGAAAAGAMDDALG